MFSNKSTAPAIIVAMLLALSQAPTTAQQAVVLFAQQSGQQPPAQSVQQSAPLTLLQQGLRYAAAKKLREAEFCFRQSCVEHPEDAIAHYYLANLLAYSKRHPEAIKEYQTCYERDPFGVASGYCRKALLSYNVPVPELETAQKESTVISAAERLGKAAPVSSSRADTPIRVQAEREKSRNRMAADLESSAVLRATVAKEQKIKEAAAAEIDAVLYPPPGSYLQRYNQMHPEEASAAARQMKANADENVKLERTLAEYKAAAYKQRSKEQEKALDEVASNLERQLASKVVPGSAQLREVGTGLFVRYYGRSSDPAPEVHNGVARVVRHAVALHSPASDDASNSDDADSPAEAESTVRGAVMK